MAQEMCEEEAKKYLVCFADNSRDLFGFGIDRGPGLPAKSRLLFYRMYHDPMKQNCILYEEESPFTVMWRIDFTAFQRHIVYLCSLACSDELFQDSFLVAYKMCGWLGMSSKDIFEGVDIANCLIESLKKYFSREEILFVPE